MKQTVRRLLAAAVGGCLCLALALPGMAAGSGRDVSREEALAEDLKNLGLFRGISDTDFALDRAPTREEGIVLLVRALGKESEALAGSWTYSFADVPDWAAAYVGYAYENGLTNGESETKFGAGETCSEAMFLTFLLRALGYSDAMDEDFAWDTPWALASDCGILPEGMKGDIFLRADAVTDLYAALAASLKDGGQTLAERLEEQGAFSREQYEAAIDENTILDWKALDAAVSAAIQAHEGREGLSAFYFGTESHVLLETAREGDTIRVSALYYSCIYHFSKDGGSGSAAYSSLASIALRQGSDGTYSETDYWSLWDTESDPEASLQSRFSDDVLSLYSDVGGDLSFMQKVCDKRAETYRTEVFEAYQPTYEQALQEVLSGTGMTVQEQLEGKDCTVLYGVLGGIPHAPYYFLYVVGYDGSMVSLPLPKESGWGNPSEPENLRLSEDKATLYYEVTFTYRAVIDEGLDSEMFLHEKGVYRYSVSLPDGEVALEITEE
ncbi:hypothetical protein [Papillibacter cinnamivorans]|uniref:SLH domain-containing protein n=1 Tax=Papillibacter cinnamivorans DSM 12816 TaxID=1122930 RepID=A0A1W1ZQW4_9FIRM|nr:hypothetical protein [Papillibacter cinnamivorans]SMC50819.1 hypothetical protein SAMN02745168_1307 [Papillibacter cinnamivorans DSM 12816]